MSDASRIMSEGKTPAQWVVELAARGINVGERSLRERARALGACRVLGHAMILYPEHIDQIFGIEPKAPAEPAMLLAAVRASVVAVQPDEGLSFDLLVAEDEPGNVYFLRAGNRIKIGFATVFERRLDTLRAGSSVPLEVVAVIPGSRRLEYLLHGVFADLRRHGEWFEETGALRSLTVGLERLQ